MGKNSLFFNILTFDWPSEPLTFYFSNQDNRKSQKLHFSLFPNEAERLFPGTVRNSTNELYTTFTGDTDGFQPVQVDFRTENPDLIKRYYNRQINFYFRTIQKQIVKVGFVKENQVWLKSSKTETSQWWIYERFSLKVQLNTVSKFPDILLSYDGQSKVSKRSAAELIQEVSPTCFNWVISDNQIKRWDWIQQEEDPDYEKCFPVFNKNLEGALGIPAEAPPRDNRYPKYLNQIQAFYKKFIDTPKFKELIPLHNGGFLDVPATRIDTTSPESNQLLFGSNESSAVPKFALRDHKPFKASPYSNIHLFFILHDDDKDIALKLDSYFKNGYKWFKGMYDYARLLFHTPAIVN